MSIKEIEVTDLKAVLDGGGVLIDVREADEYIAGHIPSAASIPLSTITVDFERFRSANDVYVVCRSGSRSMQACEFLVDHGIVNVVNVAGGTMAWQASGCSLNLGYQP